MEDWPVETAPVNGYEFNFELDLNGTWQREEEARVWSDDGSVLDKESQEQRETQQNKIVPRHHLEHSTSNSLSIQALSHDLAGSDSCGEVHVEDNQNMSFPSWEGTFMRCFSEIDEKLAKNIDTNGFLGGSTSVSVIKQSDQVIIGNVGDSCAVLCRRAPDNHLIPVQLTVDLAPDIPREALRIFAVEEDPTVNRVWMPERDCPGLAMISDVLTNSEVINIVASAPKRSMAAKLFVNHAVRALKYKYGFEVDDCSSICFFQLKD
ncbi:probable protein phosphatase 2C 73 [Glycine soja]|uniref:probable protein phosphatase 2C 73 n=1 Tax=Glycine soja TaxID=3848 RepID=UPI00103EFCBA|nr:probable protein phosphatase 2C 73 [Glycine soja]